jgi:hypothetical protein
LKFGEGDNCPLKSEIAQRCVIVGTTSQRPVRFALALLDRQIVDAGDAPAHQALLVEFPVLVAIAAEPIAAVVMLFVSEPHRDAVLAEGPDLLDQAVIQLPGSTCASGIPLWQRDPGKTRIYFARYYLCKRDAGGITRVPCVLGHSRLLRGGMCG